jgi:UDP-N-acetylglucosamine:LPS N-acetylglucosamine transferase
LINAQKLMDLGAVRMIRDEELNGSSLAQTILHLYNHPEERARMEEKIRQVARPKAAQEIVEHCYKLLGRME